MYMLVQTVGLTSPKCIKVFFVICTFISVWCMYTRHSSIHIIKENEENPYISPYYNSVDNVKYILLWTKKETEPFNFLGDKRSIFIKQKCYQTNCYVTDDRNLLGDPRRFDAVLFNARDMSKWKVLDMPKERSYEQKFVFVCVESPMYYSLCNTAFDDFFNWTWTYKLNSDIRWGYFSIFDFYGHLVGPAIDIAWPKRFEPILDDVKFKLKNKSKAAAWLVSHCFAESGRGDFVQQAMKELEKYGWTVDIYGLCGKSWCPSRGPDSCFKRIERDYYFYFSFENTFAEDYVTEKLLTALNHYAVPVVYGDANYSRFLAPGSYLNARELGPQRLAHTMDYIIRNQDVYHEFFRWRNHYTYRSTLMEDICNICDALHNETMVKKKSSCVKFREWWNVEKC